MKHILLKINFQYFLYFTVAGCCLFESCTKKFEEYNTDPFGITNKDLSADFRLIGEPLKQVQLNIYISSPAWNTQLQQNLIGDVYSGYMGVPTPFAGNQNNMTYALVDGWNTYPWDDAYNGVMAPALNVFKNAGTSYPAFVAWAKLLRVEAMHRVSDIYGPIIYSKYGQVNANGSISYDSQKDAYYAFFNDLDSAITTLTPLAQSTTAVKQFTSFDFVYGGDYKEWVKFANTLRLRLALRIVNIDPVKAQTEGQKALANPIGLLTANTDNFNINLGTTTHPLNTISGSWGDIRFGAPLSSYLNGYSDARATKYALPATDPAVAGKIIGIHSGINIDSKDRYEGYSALVSFPNSIQLMTSAEAWFLKAEAALRGWSGAGDAKTNYETGIKTSFAQYGLDATTYISNSSSTPAPYIDPKSVTAGQNNITSGSPYLSTITIQWNTGASFSQNLERIITQKWLAMYPDGQEAWSEFRRTGFPKLYPNIVNYSNGAIPSANFVRRINFALSERNTNPTGVAAAVALLVGPDNGGTRLWWDKP